MKQIRISDKQKRILLTQAIKEMKELNFSIEVISNYEEQLTEVINTIDKDKEHDRQQEIYNTINK